MRPVMADVTSLPGLYHPCQDEPLGMQEGTPIVWNVSFSMAL